MVKIKKIKNLELWFENLEQFEIGKFAHFRLSDVISELNRVNEKYSDKGDVFVTFFDDVASIELIRFEEDLVEIDDLVEEPTHQ